MSDERLPDNLIALTEARAAALSQMTVGQLRRLAKNGLVGPTVQVQVSPKNTVRLYGFHDLEALLVVGQLLDHYSYHLVGQVLAGLRERYDRPLNELVFTVDAGRREIVWMNRDGQWEGSDRPLHGRIRHVLPIEEIRATIRAAVDRDERDRGEVRRDRGVLGSAERFAGTRVRVETVADYFRHEVPEAEIREAFPRLTSEDLALARERAMVG